MTQWCMWESHQLNFFIGVTAHPLHCIHSKFWLYSRIWTIQSEFSLQIHNYAFIVYLNSIGAILDSPFEQWAAPIISNLRANFRFLRSSPQSERPFSKIWKQLTQTPALMEWSSTSSFQEMSTTRIRRPTLTEWPRIAWKWPTATDILPSIFLTKDKLPSIEVWIMRKLRDIWWPLSHR